MIRLDTLVRIGIRIVKGPVYWARMNTDVAFYINSCPRCLRKKSQLDQALLLNIEANQPLELIHLDFLKIEPSKRKIENVLVITGNFTRYA